MTTMTTTDASPELENEQAEDRNTQTKPAATPRKPWNKPTVTRIYQGLFFTANGGPSGPNTPESSTYTHVS